MRPADDIPLPNGAPLGSPREHSRSGSHVSRTYGWLNSLYGPPRLAAIYLTEFIVCRRTQVNPTRWRIIRLASACPSISTTRFETSRDKVIGAAREIRRCDKDAFARPMALETTYEIAHFG
jgi:hypothetical protein